MVKILYMYIIKNKIDNSYKQRKIIFPLKGSSHVKKQISQAQY